MQYLSMCSGIEAFKSRNLKAKDLFTLREIPKNEAYQFIKTFHYLGGAKFFSQYSIGLFILSELVGVATFTLPQGNVAIKGWVGEDNSCKWVMELSRLCVLPLLNGSNATSYLLSNAMSLLKSYGVRLVTTLADSSRHVGSIYQVCNFKFYGLTSIKSDFYRYDGVCNPRGPTNGVKGVWVPRTREYRYAFKLDKNVEVLYGETIPPKSSEQIIPFCCGGLMFVEDKRYGHWYTCPHCNGVLNAIN